MEARSSRASLPKPTGQCLAAAALYVLAGIAGILLTQSAGYASPIWPASGVAVATLLAWGWRCWPGIWLGSLLIDLWFEPSPLGVVLAALTAAGATLQALLGAWLVRRYRQGRDRLPRDWSLAALLVCAGPLACLISASLGAAVLLVGGRIPADELFNEWLRWWAGDTLGVLLFAPLACLFWPGNRACRFAAAGSYRFALPLLVTGTLLVVAHLGLAQLEELRARSEARARMAMIGEYATRDIAETLLPLEGLAHFMAASERVTREEFRQYAQSFAGRPAILAVDWAPRVPETRRSAFEASVAREGFAGFRISELDSRGRLQPAAPRAEYFPILFSEPLAASERLLGLDHGFEPARRQAMMIARTSGKAISSDLIRLVRSERHATLAFIPVRRLVDGRPEETLSGYVVGVFDIQALFAPLLGRAEENHFAVRISDISGASPRILVDALPANAAPAWQRDFDIDGRLWRLEMLPSRPLWQPGSTAEERLFLGVAILTALLAAFATLSGAERQEQVSRQVGERTRQLKDELDARSAAERALHASEERYRQLIELSPFGVLVQCEGRCMFVNARTVAMFGAGSADQLLGQALLDYVHPDSRAIALERLTRRAEGRAVTDSAVVHYRRLDGSYSWVELTSVPYQYEGRPGSLILLNDVSARIRAEQQRDRFFTLSLDLFCIAGTDGYFRSVNPAFSRILGWSEEELLARPIVDFVHPEDVEQTCAELALIAQGRSTVGFENRYRCKDGSWRWLAWKALPQPGDLLFATAHDTTAQHLAARQLSELNAELRQRVEERSQALDELQAAKEEIRAVLDHLLECVITIDSRGTVRSVNPAIEPLLGYRPEELLGRNVSCLMDSPLREQHDDYLARYLLTGERHIVGSSREVSGRHKDGHPVDLELSVSEYSVRGERLFIGTLRDIGERKALIASLTQAREEAEQASRAKSAFLANMSHEIRTPMNGVVGLIDVLAQERLPTHQADLVKTIRESSSNLLGVVDDILDFSKIEAGRLEVELAPLDLRALIDNLCGTLQPLAASRGVELEHAVEAGTPQWVLSDALRLRQILLNLIGNAIKFSGGRSERRGRVRVCVRSVGGDPLRVRIAVEDNGIGIAAEHLGQLFNPFSQAESTTTRRFGGSGLGLAICKRLVELLGGRIEVASSAGRGSRFSLSLPFAPAEAPPLAAAEVPAPPQQDKASRASRRILVVEDDAVNRKVVEQQLSVLGYDFTIAGNGAEALAVWRGGACELILTDLHMPDMDGYQLTAQIRDEEAGRRRIPILALTANALRGEAARAKAAGMDEYLTKPIRLAALEAALEHWLPREAETPQASGADRLLEPAALGALVGDDRAMIAEILHDYLKALRSLRPQLQEAFARRDIDGVGALAHRLKSSSRAVGAGPLGQLFEDLEQAVRTGDSAALARGMAELAARSDATAARIEQFLEQGVHA
ncbi:PAS domain S-box protein [Pseudomonas stutzeri]|nr:PAS domain S-box protein [Stutzerimonas stutzeri]